MLNRPRPLRPGGISIAGLAAVLLLAGCSGTAGASSASTPPVASKQVASFSSASAAAGAAVSARPTSTTGPASETSPASTTGTAAATVGALVPDFPRTLIPVMPGATVESSSVQRGRQLSIVSLVASSSSSNTDIATYYIQVLERHGFKALPGNTVGSTPSRDFVRSNGQETATVSLVTSGRLATVSVSASVLTASLK
ncbi:hypothetical protein IV498_03920 [Paenarthrobacter sp. Z7-10]|uniref:hypothetical protein n=1 Tax=Paenarthrobacter sp. Z7-10 TaxID=2787635 RepID=UPI0022A8DD28|nr:hypothetical protein [Paenarthrobacter sp. Z7-10]MCZ2402349.1 hypothetical protein [Paenarthrobacter sp. Z7-10]